MWQGQVPTVPITWYLACGPSSLWWNLVPSEPSHVAREITGRFYPAFGFSHRCVWSLPFLSSQKGFSIPKQGILYGSETSLVVPLAWSQYGKQGICQRLPLPHLLFYMPREPAGHLEGCCKAELLIQHLIYSKARQPLVS